MKLLLVENDELLGEALVAGLGIENYTVDWVTDGDAAVRVLAAKSYDTVLLDLGLPKRSGLDVLKKFRSTRDLTPVLVLTARDRLADKVEALDSGADDYLVKPFDLAEVCARVRALIRRSDGRGQNLIRHRDVVLNPANLQVTKDDKIVALSRREFTILHKLIAHPGRIMSKDTLEQTLYRWDEEVESNAIQVHIHHLRKKLGKDLVRTVRGMGYMIE
jgi:DNA-binding response OmpR family regulator